MILLKTFLFVFFTQSLVHPIHVSVTEVEMDEKDKRLEIMMRVFADDLELALRKAFNKPDLDILSISEAERDRLVSQYLTTRFRVSLDNKQQKHQYLGHEQEDIAFIFYIEVPNVQKWKRIHILNNIIMETYDDQSNLVHVTVKEKVRSLRLTRNNPADELEFDF